MANLDKAPSGVSMRFRSALAMAACLLLMLGGYVFFSQFNVDPESPAVVAENSPITTILALAEERRAEREYATAHRLLKSGWNQLREVEDSHRLLQKMADIAFEDLQWYTQAYAHYGELRIEAFEAFQARDENIYRLSLLEESRGDGNSFAPLRALDAAIDAGTLDELNRVMASHAGTIVGKLAAEEATRVALRELGLGDAPSDRMAALEEAIQRADHPAARAQLQLMAGSVSQDAFDDADRARQWYEAVARSGVGPLADEAQRALARLNSPEE